MSTIVPISTIASAKEIDVSSCSFSWRVLWASLLSLTWQCPLTRMCCVITRKNIGYVNVFVSLLACFRCDEVCLVLLHGARLCVHFHSHVLLTLVLYVL